MQEQWEGYTLVNLINELSRNGNVEEIAEALQSIAKHVLKKHRLRVLLTTEASQRDKSQKAVEKFLSEIPNETVSHSTALEVCDEIICNLYFLAVYSKVYKDLFICSKHYKLYQFSSTYCSIFAY